jgi:CRISPR-associated protein Csy3
MAYQEALQQAIEDYISEQGFAELARRYAANLANGRFCGATALALNRSRFA